MTTITTSEINELSDPKLRQIALRIVRDFELSAEKVAANHADPARFPLSSEANSAERILEKRFKALPDKSKKVGASKALARMAESPSQRSARLGDLAQVDMSSARSVEAQVESLPMPAALKLPSNFLAALRDVREPAAAAASLTAAARPSTNKLELLIHSVRCVDETKEFSADEISLGGSVVDESGETRKVAAFNVGSFSKDGATKTYSPPRRFTYFNLAEGKEFPKSYFVILVLAEVDGGGLPEFISQLFNKIRDKVTSALAAAIGGAVGTLGGPLGTLIGTAAGFIVGEVFRLFKAIWQDDIFAPCRLRIDIPSLTHRFPGNATDSPEAVATFTGFGGTYQVRYGWRLFA